MTLIRTTGCLAFVGTVMGVVTMWSIAAAPSPDQRAAAQKQFQAGNFKDAYEAFRKLALDPNDDPLRVGDDLTMAVQCLQRLGRVNESDAFREEVIKVHAGNWRLLRAAAESYQSDQHYGFIVAGKFERGQHRGGGQQASSEARDRARALQLLVQALPLADQQKNDLPSVVGSLYLSLAHVLVSEMNGFDSWRFQTLSDLATLPDYEEGYWYRNQEATGAPVGPDGQPVYYHVPTTFTASTSDGERWRWALAQAEEINPQLAETVRWEFARFLQSQFGVETLASYNRYFQADDDDDGRTKQSGIYALDSLAEDETLARLATGIKRFKLPDEFNYIRIYQRLAAQQDKPYAEDALEALAHVFQDRRQYEKAADHWRRLIKTFGRGPEEYRQKALDQITDNWGRLEGGATQPAGRGATIDFRFRNGQQVHFEAHAVRVEKLLEDVKAYLKTRPNQLDWRKLDISNIGYRLVEEKQQQYVGERVAAWDLALEPRPRNFDRRITVTTPLQKAGAYLVTAKMADGNTSRTLIWIADTVIVKKPLPEKTYYYVADAVTGQPVAKAKLEFFGYRQQYLERNRVQLDTTQFAEFTDADGQISVANPDQLNNYQWLVSTAAQAGARFAFLGYTGMWRAGYYDYEYNETKVFTITDRPVYRPKQTVKFKFWIRQAQYDKDNAKQYAKQSFTVEIRNPKGDKVLEKQFTSDDYGGLDGEYDLPADCMLGEYQLQILNHGGGSFRVEEYKKPEFEVKVTAPTEPVMLGEKVTATIEAKYYFGAPVTQAKVKYKVLRSNYDQTWYPIGAWDWFYGPGYWWFASDYPWYPGWRMWGCKSPMRWWWGYNPEPPEVVAEAEVPIGEDGKVAFEIDTALAKAIHGDHDHQYKITAEVVDQSRRTIVGTGEVLVARKPFKVFAWVNRGHYRVGDTIDAEFSAQTLSHQPIAGKGRLKLLKISYDDKQEPVETAVQEWDLNTNDQGRAKRQIKASAAGQYRLSYTVTDTKGHAIEGGYLLTIVGEGFDGSQFRFNNLELVPDKREYEPGEAVHLMINTDRVGSTVLLFLRPANGVYLPPQVVRLKGKSTTVEVAVTKKDMPNFFIEAVTIADGRLYSETREIIVPPEKRVLNVAVEPSAEKYKPGQPAEVKLTLTDFFGKPFVGSTALAIYDKSVEYISGGSNVPEIKEFFWKWRRQHYPRTESSLDKYSYLLQQSNEVGMNDLGVFGATVADEWNDVGGAKPGRSELRKAQNGAMPESKSERASAGGGMGGGMGLAAATSAPAAPASGAVYAFDGQADKDAKAVSSPQQQLVQPTIRSNFADTALWVGSLTTDGDGTARVKLKMPENLTTWKVKAWGMGSGTQVGQGDVDVVTSKNLLVRLQAPRFFVQTDEVVLSANVHNYLKDKKSVQVTLELDGPTLKPLGDRTQTIAIEAGGEARVDWRVRVADEGEAIVRMKALSDEESDAVEMRFPAYIHGMLKTDSFSGAIRPEGNSGRFTFRIPAERRPAQTKLELRYSPSLAAAMVDALPYLVEYPYGCTEQTLNRFLPTVVTQKVLLDMQLDLKAIRDKRTNLNAQEIGDAQKRAEGWKRHKREPVFDRDEVNLMVREGLRALTDMQLSDGGWGWFSGYGEHSYPHTTAVVVHGLQTAQANDVAITSGVMERGIAWLKNYQDKEIARLKAYDAKKEGKQYADNLDAFVYMVLVDGGVKNADMLQYLDRDRTHLAVYAKALFGLALEKQGEREKLATVLENLRQYLVQDAENQTAYLKLPENNYWWYWYGSEIEAQAYYLKLLARTEPQGGIASGLVKYLVNNRKHATYWNSTRDTAIAIEAMADYLRASKETQPDLTVKILVDGKQQKEVRITADNLFTFDNSLVLTGEALESGEHTVELVKSGRGPLYYNGYVTNFTLEDHITAAGLEVKVDRKFYKLVKADKKVDVAGSRGQAVSQKVEKHNREELVNLASLKSGDLVEIELTIDSKNDYEYLVFEDMKAAGFEPVDVRSGYGGNALGAYMELRDNRVCFFVRALARGRHSVAYRLRAEIPGRFSALPTRASAMYAPELRGNSNELKLSITD